MTLSAKHLQPLIKATMNQQLYNEMTYKQKLEIRTKENKNA